MDKKSFSRRKFVKVAGISAAGLSAFGCFRSDPQGVLILTEPGDPISGSVPVQWAISELEARLSSSGISFRRSGRIEDAGDKDLVIVAAGSGSAIGTRLLKEAGTEVSVMPESLALVPLSSDGRRILLACGTDSRGLVYATLDLADRIRYSEQPLESLLIRDGVTEQPANKIRSLNRLFVSDIEDKPWFNDKEMWEQYLTMIATQRFNRFNLSLGIGYDFLQNVTDGYFLFAYPFLLNVPGYDVHVPELPDEERESNLRMIKFISSETVKRGIQFQLGIWMHGYEWLNSPNPNYTIKGLTPDTHGPYCRDAVRLLLKECPGISGVTFRVHGESGVTEGSYSFWKTVFDGVATCGREVEIDMHSKGMSQEMIDLAVATGLPVNISPKYWAEHLGLPYHQADIRALEIPRPGRNAEGLMNLSAGSRSFTRYGYGDLFKEDRKHGVLHRIWPGTQRLLLWGDPEMSSAHSRNFSFCGSTGVELMEPLSFKGRRGSGIAGDRCAYLDASLKPKWDWEKYLYSLRVFGRMSYNPETDPEVWQRFLTKNFWGAAKPLELALSQASRILPLVTTAHGVSAGNNTYWPEIYTNLSVVDPDMRTPYSDTPRPRVFGNVSPMDPQLFAGINEYVGQMLSGERNGKYSPVEYAQWLEGYSDQASKYLGQAEKKIAGHETTEFRRAAIDLKIMIGLGSFFGARFRSAVLYGIFEQTGDRQSLVLSLDLYKKAREQWSEIAELARDVYKPDITIGENESIRGHWIDRLPAMDHDIELMSGMLDKATPSDEQPEKVRLAIQEAISKPARNNINCKHSQPSVFEAGKPVQLELSPEKQMTKVVLYYRHVNHAERYQTVEMKPSGKSFTTSIPGEYTVSEYPLQYYFALEEVPGKVTLYPGFNENLTNQPYYVIRKS
ncbi:MAG TPA: hypothetical protein VK213_14055 [Bacteroidales bacterium]|nr:hypothetical protein [Bacteroidales bacterium]